jgi:hypothetical protein
MKFLCVPCDSPMKLRTIAPPEGGSLSVVYSCPECGYEMAMLTNPYETQVVQSLGVRIGPERAAAASGVAGAGVGPPLTNGRSAGDARAEGATTSGARCPFPAMMPAAEGSLDRETQRLDAAEPAPVRWTAAAEARLANIPAFVRPMARTGIERFARERGVLEVDETILDAAREFFGM